MTVASPCGIVPAGSLWRRPVYRMPGRSELLDTLYPRAISPDRSMAIEPIQRYEASGAYVPCWKTDRLFPPPTRSSYHRAPTELPAVIEWFTTSDSVPLMFR